jgi:hypothetical protein
MCEVVGWDFFKLSVMMNRRKHLVLKFHDHEIKANFTP